MRILNRVRPTTNCCRALFVQHPLQKVSYQCVLCQQALSDKNTRNTTMFILILLFFHHLLTNESFLLRGICLAEFESWNLRYNRLHVSTWRSEYDHPA